jgi:protein gp37
MAERKLPCNAIQWDKAKYWQAAWNPWLGCHPCSPACEHCYAAAQTARYNGSFEPHQTTKRNPPRKGVVFCGNMTDLFGEWLTPAESMGFFSRLFHFTRDGSPFPNEATYLFLTKRVSRMAEALRNYTDIPNALFGFTAEDQTRYDARLKEMVEVAERRHWWISAEPLLGAVDLRLNALPCQKPDWVVVGCESGSGKRPCALEWVESIVEQCLDAGVRVFVKQLDMNGVCERDIMRFPSNLRIRQTPWSHKILPIDLPNGRKD